VCSARPEETESDRKRKSEGMKGSGDTPQALGQKGTCRKVWETTGLMPNEKSFAEGGAGEPRAVILKKEKVNPRKARRKGCKKGKKGKLA